MSTFGKEEHLCGEININRLFIEGKAFICYPVRVVYLPEKKSDNSPACRVMVSVPKKRFKRAVKRNRLKRLMREAYRLNKDTFIQTLTNNGLTVSVAFNYVSNDVAEFAYIERKIKTALQKILENIAEP